MDIDGLHAHPQLAGDILARQAFDDQGQDLPLTRRQPLEFLPQRYACSMLRETRPSALDAGLNRVEQPLRILRLLQEIHGARL